MAWTLAFIAIGAFPAVASAGVAPGPIGMLDCNGLSPDPGLGPSDCGVCRSARSAQNGNRAEDNDHYIGHDEPSLRFVSNPPVSGNDVTFVERLGSDPAHLPTVSHPGSDYTHYFELTIAPWFSLDVCDPNSTPRRPCQPNSNSNAPNSRTLMMNPGDTIVVHMFDVPVPGGGHALEASERDVTTGQSGFMIDTQYEIGHFEPCTKVTNPGTFTLDSFSDTFWTNCKGPYDSATEDPSLEPDDAPCYPFGDTHGATVPPNLVTGCPVFTDAVGDLDYDGTPHYADWPTSTEPGLFPGATPQAQPTSHGQTYPQIRFENDMASTESTCDLTTGAGCTVPPPGPGHFYSYWTLVNDRQLGCTWQFGNAGRTGNSSGGEAQYGQVTFNSPGAVTSQLQPNPRCERGD